MAFGVLAAVDRRHEPGRRRRARRASAPATLMLAGARRDHRRQRRRRRRRRASPLLVAAQVLLGVGAGLFFPAGLQASASPAGPAARLRDGDLRRRLLVGLTVAAAARRPRGGERVAGRVLDAPPASPPRRSSPRGGAPRPTDGRAGVAALPVRAVLGLPTSSAPSAPCCQYGAIPFLTTYAVDEWGMSAGRRRPARRRPAALDRGQARRRRQRGPRRPDRQRPPHRPRRSPPPASPGCCCRPGWPRMPSRRCSPAP